MNKFINEKNFYLLLIAILAVEVIYAIVSGNTIFFERWF